MSDAVRLGLIRAYRRIMRPLVRILIRNGVTYEEFVRVLKSVFVEVGRQDFKPPDRPNSVARISILTGLTRQEVEQEEVALAAGEVSPKGTLNQITRILVGWHSDARFTGPYGLPIELPFHGENEPCFCDLVESHAPDVSPESMLDELRRVHAVEEKQAGKYKVTMRAYIPDSLHIDGLERLGEVVQNFISTVETNMEKSQQGTGRFERVVFADDGLEQIKLPAFDELLRKKGQQLLIELDNWLKTQQELEDPEVVRSSHRIRTGVGIYHYVEPDTQD